MYLMPDNTYMIYFKLVYHNSIEIIVDSNLRMCDLNTNIRPKIISEYNIDNYDIIEAELGENGNPINETEQTTLKDKYYMKINYLAFYIRPRNNEILQNINELMDCTCPICIENFEQPVNLHCGHIFCNSCISNWRSRGGTLCPMCRSEII